jgi:hypothetical protein
MANWYEDPAVPSDQLWWAVEHRGHPAFYLRALMSGDFAPGQAGPLARHAFGLDGRQLEVTMCQTCLAVDLDPADLQPIERRTHARGFLDVFRARSERWKRPTDPNTCWLCSNPRVPADHAVAGRSVCGGCAAYL